MSVATIPQKVNQTNPVKSVRPTVSDALSDLFKNVPLSQCPLDATFHDLLRDMKDSMDQAKILLDTVAYEVGQLREMDIEVAPLELNIHDDACKDINDRYEKTYERFIRVVKSKIYKLLNISHFGYRELSPINTDGDKALFSFVVSHRTYKDIVLLNWSYKSPDDFTRRVPARISEKIEFMRGTKLDYQPMILDGFLAYSSTKKIPIPTPDPALTIMIDDQRVVCDYWEEK